MLAAVKIYFLYSQNVVSILISKGSYIKLSESNYKNILKFSCVSNNVSTFIRSKLWIISYNQLWARVIYLYIVTITCKLLPKRIILDLERTLTLLSCLARVLQRDRFFVINWLYNKRNVNGFFTMNDWFKQL